MKELQQLMQQQLEKMIADNNILFKSNISGHEIWDLYISSFEGDPIFRDPSSSTHNCNLCNNFIKRYGNIIALNEKNEIMTLWDIGLGIYTPSCKTISDKLKKSELLNVFFETYDSLNELPYEKCHKSNEVFRLGTDQNFKKYNSEEVSKFGVVNTKEVYTFNHLHLDLPKQYVDMSGKSIESIQAFHRDNKDVFQRALEEIPLDTLELVRDLIKQGSLLDAESHLEKITEYIKLKNIYSQLSGNKSYWCWKASHNFIYARFKNELIGVLCTELAEGMELNKACENWNKRVDPLNYMKAVKPITEKQRIEAAKFIEEHGYQDSFNRRHATLKDIKVSEIKHINDKNEKTTKISILDKIPTTSSQHKRSEFDKVQVVDIEKFLTDILPTCKSVEVYLENKHENNLVTLTTIVNDKAKPIFKWNNNYSWTYNGNLAGKSQIKKAVKNAGGNVEGVLRGSLIWNESGKDTSDLDIWVKDPVERIGYSTGYRKDSGNRFSKLNGQLDLDNTHPGKNIGIENIYYNDLKSLKDGTYIFSVNPFSPRNSQGFKFEIEFNGEIYSYQFDGPVKRDIKIATVKLEKGVWSIVHDLTPTSSEGTSKELYGLKSNEFHKVNLICLSPNHWGDTPVGNKHYMFLLNKCKNLNDLRTFHNENLNSELLSQRKVLDVLGDIAVIPPVDEQLSGLGFNATVSDEVIVKVTGTHKRIFKIKIN
jgi:hypothetical protein